LRVIRRALAVTAILGAAIAAFAVVPKAQAAEPDPPCEWSQRGTHSTCDGMAASSFNHDTCGTWSSEVPYAATIYGPGDVELAYLQLRYIRGTATSAYPSGVCRVAYAQIWAQHQWASCYVKVERTSDGQAYRASDTTEDGFPGVTQVVYDAGVRAYAWGYCEFFGSGYSAGTPAY
jgi:hypothetical protein